MAPLAGPVVAGAVVLPGSIALTIGALALFHQTFNLMTLGGVAAAVGLVLDDAIVVVEHVAHRVAEDRSPEKVRGAVAEIVPVLTGSSLCTLAILCWFDRSITGGLRVGYAWLQLR